MLICQREVLGGCMSNLWKILVLAVICVAAAVAVFVYVFPGESEYEVKSYAQFITTSEARIKMSESQAFIIDVRSSSEFLARRIPGAVNINYLDIISKQNLLPQDKNTLILVYCHTYRRSTQAAQFLLDLGYTNIFYFPGMMYWEYETESG